MPRSVSRFPGNIGGEIEDLLAQGCRPRRLVQSVGEEAAAEHHVGRSVVAVDAADRGERLWRNIGVDVTAIDIGEAHGHPAGPLAAIAVDLLRKALFGRQEHESSPTEHRLQRLSWCHAPFADAARQKIDSPPDCFAVDMRELVQSENHVVGLSRRQLERIFGGTH